MLESQRNLADLPGLETTVREATRAFRQGVDAPGSAILADMRLSLPVPSWAEFSFVDNIDAVIGAGQAVTVTALQVPADERAWLEGFQMERTAGDNNLTEIQITAPDAFGSSPQQVMLIRLVTPATILWWPDPGGVQTIDKGLVVGPLLLEPLTNIEMTTDGSGAGASTFRVQVMRRRMKLTRAESP